MQRRKFIGHISKAGMAVAAAASITGMQSFNSFKNNSGFAIQNLF
jgi:hypothetical protein